ncbi:hypothetical protein C9374_000126 [Naegleria lovaniensis]|uniref:Cleavage/polyadenylation specificity factor A subunit C-terminal domain-containing protein n=1 Tax=Naegleria lovaniensis TaxID=51637 RepID=A0AA88GTP0_NAELO|nr:uncharacterized protein C9374_000126 [Naegleria lovaniensis]KAG2388687.1 hypothetical protein C9374_000126 [Naegleria lovaniensis]
MYACFKQLHPPTAVSFCLSARFTSPNDENLIIAKNHVMEVYSVNKKDNSVVLVRAFELFGVIDSIVAVTLQGMKKNILIINFEDEAKASVVEFDEKKNDLRTLSLHYFEDDFLKEGRAKFFHNQPIILDPHNRFATIIVCDSKLVILPFKQVGEDASLSTDDTFLMALSDKSMDDMATRLRKSVERILLQLSEVQPKFKDNSDLSINFKQFDGPPLFFDTVAYAFVSPDKVLVSMKEGDLYTIYLDGGGSRINNITLKKTKTTTPASCMCTLSGNLLFLGSRLGDSVLYEYSEIKELEEENTTTNGTMDDEAANLFNSSTGFEPEKKKRKVTTADDFLAALEQDDASSSAFLLKSSKKEMTTIDLKIRNLFTNIGPISHLTIADTSVDISGFKSRANDNNLSVIACSGTGRHGRLTVLNRSVQPDAQNTAKLPFAVKQMWTVAGGDSIHDSYVILSLEDKTKVLESKTSLDEVTSKSTFVTNDTTINIGKLKNHVVQVTSDSVIFLDRITLKRTNEHRSSLKIRASFILDPYILLHLKDGTLQLLTMSSTSLKSEPLRLSDPKHGKITAVTFYKALPELGFLSSSQESLYLCCIYLTDGTFEIYTIPQKTCVFSFSQFYQFHSTVFDEGARDPSTLTETEVKYPYVSQMLLRGVGSESEMPYLITILSDNTVHIYKSFLDRSTKTKDTRLNRLRFSKTQHDDFLPSDLAKKNEELRLELRNEKNIFSKADNARSRLIPFNNIGGYRGIFFTGERPLWFFTEYSNLRIHPQQKRESISGFTPYHHRDCPHGFIYFVENENKFTILSLSSKSVFNSYWPHRKVLLKSTPNLITYHQETNTCLVFTSVPMKAILPEDRPLPSGRYPPAVEQKHTVRLFSGNDWEEMDNYDFELHESVLAAKVVSLSKEEYNDDTDISFEEPLNSRNQDLVTMVAVGTAYVQSERELCRGRLLLFDLEPILGSNRFKINLMSSTSVKGPITRVEQVDRYLVCSVGNRIYTYYFDWNEKRMHITSFYDTQFYTSSLNCIRNFILYGDIYKSVTFLRWREKGHRLIPMAKDNRPLQVITSEFLVNDQLLGMAVVDANKNLQVFQYLPQHQESNDGRNLVPVCDFHIGTLITTVLRMKMRDIPDEITIAIGNPASTTTIPTTTDKKQPSLQKRDTSKTNPNFQFILFGSIDGSIGYVAPINELTHRRLYALQLKMYTQLEHSAGLHPKAFRLYKPLERTEYNYKKNIIDGQLIWMYAHLNTISQRDLARQIGTNAENILRNIQELNQGTYFF